MMTQQEAESIAAATEGEAHHGARGWVVLWTFRSGVVRVLTGDDFREYANGLAFVEDQPTLVLPLREVVT